MMAICFRDNLKELRTKRKWSKVQAAKEIGITPGAYGNYEYGNREPNIETIVKISEVFDVSIDYLILGVNDTDFE